MTDTSLDPCKVRQQRSLCQRVSWSLLSRERGGGGPAQTYLTRPPPCPKRIGYSVVVQLLQRFPSIHFGLAPNINAHVRLSFTPLCCANLSHYVIDLKTCTMLCRCVGIFAFLAEAYALPELSYVLLSGLSFPGAARCLSCPLLLASPTARPSPRVVPVSCWSSCYFLCSFVLVTHSVFCRLSNERWGKCLQILGS